MPLEDASKNKDIPVTLESGTYEIIRGRVLAQGKELRSRLDQLNQARKEIFGSIEPALIATERISTQNNCIPRDMVSLNGDQFIFGYNVLIGLKSETHVSDVFAVYEYRDHTFHKLPPDILSSERFEKDFRELYKYYRETRFAKFSVIGPHLFMVFWVGKSPTDIKTFKWLLKDGELSYVDNRSDHEFKFPSQHEFSWIRTHRDLHRPGMHPHISIEDKVFVEAIRGDITFKVEDNTDSGQGIYSEPVENPDQTLDDAEISYAVLGHIVLVRIRPYQEEKFRHFIFNEKTQEVVRVDEIEDACVMLPDNQGLIFPNGYYLQTGEIKQFESHLANMVFESRTSSANGEDFLYVFYNQDSGDYVLLSYNLIEQKIETPFLCNGFSYFDSGEMLLFRAGEEPVKHHVVQIWQTPLVRGDYAFSEKSDAFLFKIGNPGIVRCMAECNEMLKILNKEEVYAGLYIDLVKHATDILDTYFWINQEDAFVLSEVILQIRETASAAIDEFEKVVRLRKNTAEEVARVAEQTREILDRSVPEYMEDIDHFVRGLSDLRGIRGEIISLQDLRYADPAAIEHLEADVIQRTEALSALCVEFLLRPESLTPYKHRVEKIGKAIENLTRVKYAEDLQADADASSGELEMLIEIVSNLKIDDATETTRIIDNISDIYARVNQVKAALGNKRKSLRSIEGIAQFNAQMKLLNQGVVNYLNICDTPEKCDEYLTKLMIRAEELESQFADFDEFVVQLAEKRNELHAAFESRKLGLVEARNKKANALMSAADRILKGVQHRAGAMDDISEINGYFASDLMVFKIRDIVEQLIGLDDTVKADDIQSRLKTVREDAVRQLKDRQDLYVDGENVIQLGMHQFSVNVQPLDLTIVPRDGKQFFHLTGTNFFEPITDAAFLGTELVWNMEVVSENRNVYRAEYLAFQMLRAFETREKSDVSEEPDFLEFSDEDWLAHVQTFMGPRYSEGYAKGIHDHDATNIFKSLMNIHTSVGLLRFHPRVRALGRLFWILCTDEEDKARMVSKMNAFGIMNQVFPGQKIQDHHVAELGRLLTTFVEETSLFDMELVSHAAHYLFHELMPREDFAISQEASDMAAGFLRHLRTNGFMEKFKDACSALTLVPPSEFEMVRDWLSGYASMNPQATDTDYVDEAAVLVLIQNQSHSDTSLSPQFEKDAANMPVIAEIEGMTGDHGVIQNGIYHLNYHTFLEKLTHHETIVVPLFLKCQELKKQLSDQAREDMRLEEFRPRILTSFVRNQLINEVYLPLVGDNLAKQIGVVGEAKRTDRMGLLLLISPPGYGKTTLMEYVANRLGLIFMKISGPAIGHQVTSLDPAEAPNASAREEIQKLSLSLEMGDNVMIYVDDIQHCNPELLQKFISLCDAQRKIEGVYKGKTRTYDLRGKKVVVVMAGNPFTESGEKFRIPDMLANRADTYNLGDIIGGHGDVFKASYLENALTSNPILNRLSSKSQQDVHNIIRIAETGTREGVEFAGTYAAEEVGEMVSVMEKLIKVRDVILKVNQAYIYSASQADEYRTEPAFKLQGSYRNMNRIAEKIVPIMNDAELRTLLLSLYENEAQTLTSGAEANMLKFRELTGWMRQEDAARWDEIRKAFKKHQRFHGADAGDPVNRVVAQLSAFQDGLESIKDVLADAAANMHRKDEEGADTRVATQVSFSHDTLSKLEQLVQEMNFQLSRPSFASYETDTNTRKPGNHFYLMLKHGNLDAVGTILDNGQNPNVRSSEGATPLMAAVVHNHPALVRLLLDRGARINDQDNRGYTPLMIASSQGRLEIAEILLDHGADMTPEDKDGFTALMWAKKNGHEGLVGLLQKG